MLLNPYGTLGDRALSPRYKTVDTYFIVKNGGCQAPVG